MSALAFPGQLHDRGRHVSNTASWVNLCEPLPAFTKTKYWSLCRGSTSSGRMLSTRACLPYGGQSQFHLSQQPPLPRGRLRNSVGLCRNCWRKTPSSSFDEWSYAVPRTLAYIWCGIRLNVQRIKSIIGSFREFTWVFKTGLFNL